MTQIICLANSWKRGERCIAGIEKNSRKWIRPIYSLYPDGQVPEDIRLIEDQEPGLLDILDIPLEKYGPDFGFESENITIAPGKWERIGQVQPKDLLLYCQNYPYILHNPEKYVTVPFLQSLPFKERRTLELVYAQELSVRSLSKGTRVKWKASLLTVNGNSLTDVTITDPIFVQELESGHYPQNPCLVTVSLSMPYRPFDWEDDDPCWKLIAGVIELSNLSESDLILVEMMRVGWNIKQGRSYLKSTYNKCSRLQLTVSEITEFLNYLKSLPNSCA